MAREPVSWWHSLELAPGQVTPGIKPPDQLEREWAALRIPDLRGRTVLDVGAWDGYFSFAAERAGAARVVALDYLTWEVDLVAYHDYCADCERRGVAASEAEAEAFHDPVGLPGMRGFNLAREALGSSVEPLVADLLTLDAEALGSFDIVLCLGVLYHLREPLRGAEQLRRLTGGLAVVESEAFTSTADETSPLFCFHGVDYLGGGPGNFFVPNAVALRHLLLAAGFDSVSEPWQVDGSGPEPAGAPRPGTFQHKGLAHSRLFLHARP